MRGRAIFGLLPMAILSAASVLASPAGDLDPAFGDRGRVLLREPGFEEFAGTRLFVDPVSGRLLVVADGYQRDALLRFENDGSVDRGFGDQGVLLLKDGDDFNIADAVQLPDGRLLIAGAANVYGDPDNVIHGTALLTRLHADGTTDASFGSGGRAVFRLGGVYEGITDIFLQPDGRIVVLGSTDRTGGIERVLARYTANGTLDTGFGNSATPGYGIVDAAGQGRYLTDMVQQADGRFLGCGYVEATAGAPASSKLLAVRVRANGSLDPNFGNAGKLLVGGWQEPITVSHCRELADGHLLFAGSSGDGERTRAAIVRLSPDGGADAAFGEDGLVELDTGMRSTANEMLLMADGSLAIAGRRWKINDDGWSIAWVDLLVARIDPASGAIDRDFGDRGMTYVDFGAGQFRGLVDPAAITQQPDGKLLIVGAQIDLYDWYHYFSVAIARVDPYGAGSNGWVGMADAYKVVRPGPGTVAVKVRRTGGGTGSLSVGYRTADGTATAGQDYVARNGTLTWPAGDMSDRAILVDILNAELATSAESFTVQLSASSGGLAADRATISISRNAPVSPAPPAPGGQAAAGGASGGGGAAGVDVLLLLALGLACCRRSAVRRARAPLALRVSV